ERRTVTGQAAELEQQVHVGATLLDTLDPLDGRRVEVLAADQAEAGGRLVEVRDDHARGDAPAVAELDAGCPPVLDQHASHGCLEPDLATLVRDRAGQ